MSRKKGSIVRQVIERFDSLAAVGQSRHIAKLAVREDLRRQGRVVWNPSTGRIHSHTSRKVYQTIVLHYARWAKAEYGIRSLATLDERADEIAPHWLELQIATGKRPTSLKTYRSALRIFHGKSDLAANVAIPARRREDIVRSRRPVASDKHFSPARHVVLVNFLRATGLRRREAAWLRVEDVLQVGDEVLVHVLNGKGGKTRIAPVLRGREAAVLEAIQGKAPGDFVFGPKGIPHRLDVQALRRGYAQVLYLQHACRALPPTEGRLPKGSYDPDAAMIVSHALGHNRLDVTLRHYLR